MKSGKCSSLKMPRTNIVIYLCILVTYDKEAGFSYVNKYLHLLETEAPLLLSKQEPGPGVK
jgi:hypothetical protein